MRARLRFRSAEAERRFLQHLHSEEYRGAVKWPFTLLATLSLLTLLVRLAMLMVQQQQQPGGNVVLSPPSVVEELASVLLWGCAGLAGFQTRAAPVAARLVWPLSLAWGVATIWVTLSDSPGLDFSPAQNMSGLLLPGVGYTAAAAPLDGLFQNGVLVVAEVPGRNESNRTTWQPATGVCGGQASSPPTPDGVVTACASVAFQGTIGTLQFVLGTGMFFYNMLTVPSLLMMLGLPFREYVLTLCLPMGMVVGKLAAAAAAVDGLGDFIVQAGVPPSFSGSTFTVGMLGVGFLAADAAVVFASCLASAFVCVRTTFAALCDFCI